MGFDKSYQADDDLNKLFVRLSRAFAARGEAVVSIPELKMAVAKTLTALISKLDAKSNVDEDITLINNQENKQ